MENYLNTPIKELIIKFPEIGEVLEDYQISCASCFVGSCLMKDIIEVHNLAAEEEKEVMAKISKIIFPDQEISIPRIERKNKFSTSKISYSPPLKMLVEEHMLIKRWINLIPEVIKHLDAESNGIQQIIYGGADFIRSYADKFHHAKEEEILFKYFDENLEIIKTMLEEHEKGRGCVRSLIESAAKKDNRGMADSLLAYQELLTEHIKKEDEILYPWMDRNLSINHIGKLFSEFKEVEEKGNGIKEKYTNLILNLEEKFKNKKGGKNENI